MLMTHIEHNGQDHYCIQRDRQGHLRADCGTGRIVAYASESIAVLQAAMTVAASFERAQLDAAISLLAAEERARESEGSEPE